MKKTAIIYVILTCIFITLSCKQDRIKNERIKQPDNKPVVYENLTGLMIVDTIIYDVLIKNPNPYDTWTDECLKHLNKEAFVNLLFESVYKNQATALDVLSEKVITPEELKKLEKKKDFDRNKIGKLQFTESWFYNDTLRTMSKKVISVALGYETYDDQGNLIGHKPVFKIYLN